MRSVPLDPHDADDGEVRGLWDRFMDRVGLGPLEDGLEQEPDAGRRRKPVMLRFHHSKINRICVWQGIDCIDNARQAADGLKQGCQQVVNLERAAPEVAMRIIDFLNGVTYALDGYVEQVGEKVFLFTPANTIVEIEDGEGRRVEAPYQEN
jgi:cell division inhibitor SepF